MMRAPNARSRSEPETLRWLTSLSVAAALHLALASCFYYVKQTTKEIAMPPPAAPIMVELAPVPVASLPASVESVEAVKSVQKAAKQVTKGIADVPVKEVAHASVKVAVKDKDKVRPDKSLPTATELTNPDKSPPKKPVKELAEDASEARQSRPDNSIEQKAEKNQAPQVGAASNAQRQAKLDWESQLLAKLQQAKRYPANAIRNKQEDLVMVRFVMDGEGRVLTVGIAQSRGYELLDRESLALIKRAAPLPKPPLNLMDGNQQLEMVVPIEFFIRHEV